MMQPIRILHCIFTSGVGGLEMGVVKLVNNITAPDISHAICTFTEQDADGGNCLESVTNTHCRVYKLNRRCGNDIRLVSQLMGVIKDFRPTVVHTRNWATYVEGALAAILTATPALVHGEHGTPSPGRLRHRLAYRALACRTKVVVAVSEALAQVYKSICRSWASEVRTIHNGVDERRYVPPASLAAAKVALGLPPTSPVIGSVGRFVPVKGFDVLLQSMKRITKAMPEAVLLLVGDGPEKASLRDIAKGCGLVDNVLFVGQRNNVVPYYQAMDVYVNSSHSEGISNGILEALACGVPVVGTDVGGTPEIVRCVENGAALVPPNNPDALYSALINHLEDESSRQLYRESARNAVCKHFSLGQMISQYEKLYREMSQI
jgi:sugar transferase (PEP-CTERM/EpsH1 system associated)